jgi:hypothetical protein
MEQFAGDHAAVMREYGITSAERRSFANGPKTATVTLYNMTDPSAAYGAFTFLRDPQMSPLLQTYQLPQNPTPVELHGVPSSTVPYSAGSHERAYLVIGNFLLDVSATETRPSDSDLGALAAALAPRADSRPFPKIADFLPTEGLVKGSEQYMLGPKAMAEVFSGAGTGQTDWIGFDKSAEAIVARYHLKGQEKGEVATLLIAMYPTQQIAADEYAGLNKWFALNGDTGSANGRPVVFGTRSSALLAILAGAGSRESANSLLSQVHYVSEVTWNEGSTSFTDPSISTIVVNAILNTGSIMMLAIAAGMGFGGFRLFVKFLLPGRVFDRRENVEILQLGISSKPINANDFYQ